MDAVEKGVAAKKANEEALMASMAFQSYGPGQAVILPSTDSVRDNLKTVAKGAAIAPFTVAPDLLGITLQGLMGSPYGGPRKKLLSGDPIREAIGIDPEDPWGMAGEMVGNWENAAAKVPALLGKALTALTDPSAVKGGALLAQSLFHGTPHKFSKFELEKIGTGEGAQAYGHGLYFAESPGVAKSYQNVLAQKPRYSVDGREIFSDATDFTDVTAANALDDFGGDVDEAVAYLRDGGLAEDLKAADMLESAKEIKELPLGQGHLYEVDIPDETIGKMLDWDAPLSEQPENVRNALTDVAGQLGVDVSEGSGLLAGGIGQGTGGKIYRDIVSKMPQGGLSDLDSAPRAASRALNEAGIPGIRFFDGASRGKGEGTRNIVVFNPDDISKVKRDGELVFAKLTDPSAVIGTAMEKSDRVISLEEAKRLADPNVPADKLRTQERRYLDHLKGQIEKDGLQNPLEIENGVIMEGNHRLAVLEELGVDKVPVTYKSVSKSGKITFSKVEDSFVEGEQVVSVDGIIIGNVWKEYFRSGGVSWTNSRVGTAGMPTKKEAVSDLIRRFNISRTIK